MKKTAKFLSGIPEMSYGKPSPVCYIGAVRRLLDYLGDPIEEDELIALSGVGLCFPWSFNSDCDEVSIISEIPLRTFGALGYESSYYTEDIRPDGTVPGATAVSGRAYTKEFFIDKIRRSIDAGRPVIGFGLVTDIYACLITGYYDGGEGLFISSYQKQGSYTSDWYDRCRGILTVGEKTGERAAGEAAYKVLTDWALWFRSARSKSVTANGVTYPLGEAAYEEMCRWLLNDDEWQELTSHEVFLKQSGLLLAGYYRNNLFSYVKRLDAAYPGLVNPPLLENLSFMCRQFPGSHVSDLWLNECADPEITDFTKMRSRSLREKVANYVKNNVCNVDNMIQWTLFMPDFVKKQAGETGISLVSFNYRRLPALRFIGVETGYEKRSGIMSVLDAMPEYASGFDYDTILMHHYGRSVDDEQWHGFRGRFMKAGTPVPEGFVYFDFVPENDWKPGLPYLSQFAFAVYYGSEEALHTRMGFDSDSMYDITRNIILGENIMIPYPEKYWTAEVLFYREDGSVYNPENLFGSEAKPGEVHGGYLFSVDLDVHLQQ